MGQTDSPEHEGHPAISVEEVLSAYAQGVFPMTDPATGDVRWYTADPRGVLELDNLRVPRSLAKRLRRGDYLITFDQAFDQVIAGCARITPKRPDTWIGPAIIDVYTQLHRLGLAHSVEAWKHDPSEEDSSTPSRRLVGGLYGVALAGAFFGESMFSRADDASKVCVVKLAERLRERGFSLFDIQMVTPVTALLGATEIPAKEYLQRLNTALLMGERWGG
ncbi:MAG: leucyl/phenylalanyl-tRNA--protein transferase [Phycisphaeraceae bacterium]|nr:leucyl/phenylalanyl-tRNA--protein transferase [Phycisphaeraceae bacterium]